MPTAEAIKCHYSIVEVTGLSRDTTIKEYKQPSIVSPINEVKQINGPFDGGSLPRMRLLSPLHTSDSLLIEQNAAISTPKSVHQAPEMENSSINTITRLTLLPPPPQPLN